jgi:UPF0148 protein
MADMLKQGATLTELACPVCASPIFKLESGELWCVKCKKKVVVVKEGETISDVERSTVISSLESTLLARIEEIERKMKTEKDVDQLEKLGKTLSTLLESLEKARRMKK